MSAPIILDLYCGVGGAGVGYHRAGFDVFGVDYAPQPDYPFEYEQCDALAYLRSAIDSGAIRRFDAIHASPPCQHASALTKGTNRGNGVHYPSLIEPTRALLIESGLPYVIENVQGAAVRRDVTLCGERFGLRVIRHRYFECSFPTVQPEHVPHRGRVAGMRHGEWFDGPYFAVYGDGGGKGTVAQWRDAMGIDWTHERKSIAEAIPPAYTEYIGDLLMNHLAPSGPR